jgi:hypothetical protein
MVKVGRWPETRVAAENQLLSRYRATEPKFKANVAALFFWPKVRAGDR